MLHFMLPSFQKCLLSSLSCSLSSCLLQTNSSHGTNNDDGDKKNVDSQDRQNSSVINICLCLEHEALC